MIRLAKQYGRNELQFLDLFCFKEQICSIKRTLLAAQPAILKIDPAEKPMNGAKAKTSPAKCNGQRTLGLETRFGANWPGERCGAKTRQGTSCQKPALKGRTRCQLHGGMSTGPNTAEGRQRVSKANLRHGRRTNAQIAANRERAQANREIRAALQERINMMIQDGTLPKNYRP